MPFLILGNKIDLPAALPESALKSVLGINITSGKDTKEVREGERPLEVRPFFAPAGVDLFMMFIFFFFVVWLLLSSGGVAAALAAATSASRSWSWVLAWAPTCSDTGSPGRSSTGFDVFLLFLSPVVASTGDSNANQALFTTFTFSATRYYLL